MKITISEQFTAYADTPLLGNAGETNARRIEAYYPEIPEAENYRLRFKLPNGTIYDADITDKVYKVPGSLLAVSGCILCQWLACASADKSVYSIVAKSNVFKLTVGESIDDKCISPVPTYEDAVAALDKMMLAQAHPPVISDDGNWLIWNVEQEEYIDTDIKAMGYDDYNALSNKPHINGVELIGDKSNDEIGITCLSNEEIESILNLFNGGI
ncbi:hypothetical protein [Porcipelethomonas sp.]|uniref:hypothetical protein n=1 Tax=Porcipelethomonas sp. TaxID=2981675 RepID=UPI003EF3464C